MTTTTVAQIHSAAQAKEHYEDAQSFERSDDRWAISNQFFQQADYERRLISRNDSAILASDWSRFGYREYTLEEYLQREVAAQAARRGW